MPSYTPTTWVNGVTATNQTNMNKIETQLAAVQYGVNIFSGASYLLINGGTVNSGSTTAYTATGGSTGVPSGAKAVLINLYFTSASAGAFLTSKPTGGSSSNNSNYPVFGMIQVANSTACHFAIMPLSAGGQFDLTGNGANCTGINCSIFGYIY